MQSNLIYLLLESQTHRRRADNTQTIMTAVIGFSYSFKPAPPNGERKNVAGQVDFVRLLYILWRRF